jgi:hypothetical protein
VLKVVTGWGLASGWTAATIAAVVALVRSLGGTLLVRTVHGDPSAGEQYQLPYANQIEAELAPWLAACPDAWVEIGNEWLISPQPTNWAFAYAYHYRVAVAAVRVRWPGVKIIAAAHLLNHPVALGSSADGVVRCLEIAAQAYRACDALALHAYTDSQISRGLSQLRTHVSGSMPIWLTECNINEPLSPVARAQALRALVGDAPVAVACLYHWDELGGTDPTHFNPNYRLDLQTLRALATPVAPTPTALDDLGIQDVRSQLSTIRDRTPRPRAGAPTSVTLHYNGPPVSAAGDPDRELRHIVQVDTPDHQRRLAADSLQYHYCVLSDGTIVLTRDPVLPAWHCGHAEGNRSSLAVHLPVGGLQDATTAQWAATERLFAALIAAHGMPGGLRAVKMHSEWKETLCPGPQLTRRLVAWRNGDKAPGGLYRIRGDVSAANVREGPGTAFSVALGGKARMWPGDSLDADAVTQGESVGGDTRWLHRRDGLGFVHYSLIEG